MTKLTPLEFVQRWSKSTLSERASAQSHFNDLCEMLGQKKPVEADPDGTFYTFEKHVSKSGSAGGKGFADVWYKDHFAIEYKGKHKDLEAAYEQLLRYREDLGNPPLLVVCDIARFEVHTNFTSSVKEVYSFTNDEIPNEESLRILKALFENPESLAPSRTTESVTREAAEGFAKLSDGLRSRGVDPERAAHFLNKLLFCLFAEDVGLLPKDIFSEILSASSQNPEWFVTYTSDLFRTMSTGGHTMLKKIRYFNGGLFADSETLPLTQPELRVLAQVSKLDWGSVEPAIFGTFFEWSLDPSMRAKLGAHYTSKEDILTLIEPVLMAPLRREWSLVKAEAQDLADSAAGETNKKRKNTLSKAADRLLEFTNRLRAVKVLDPACGSGNFLYMALRQMLDLEKEVAAFASKLDNREAKQLDIDQYTPQVSPDQLFGIELSPYAHELAQVVVWIGYLQWLTDNGFGADRSPVLGNMSSIRQMDAILAYNEGGEPIEPEWPRADVIVGNPPFIGDKRMREVLGDEYVNEIRKLYKGRVGGGADFVTYWFERSRELVESGVAERVGLIATNGIRYGANREVLKRIKQTGSLFFGESDREWVQNGAAVRVSMVGFDNGTENNLLLDDVPVENINSDLTGTLDLTEAVELSENDNLAFLGVMKAGAFDLDEVTATAMLNERANPNGRPNSDVVRPRLVGENITKGTKKSWIIDFGVAMSEDDAARYEKPFEYVAEQVKPSRSNNRRKRLREKWWIHGEARPGLRASIQNLTRCIVTPEVSKYRHFHWMSTSVVPDQTLHVIAREDDYFLGVLQSRAHELWSLAVGNHMGVGNDPRYNSKRTFRTFPFPWPPGDEPTDAPLVEEIARASRQLIEERNNALQTDSQSKRTMTTLYNNRPLWLQKAHAALDRTVITAYGWDYDISDDDILTNLLALNVERAAG